jgi:iron-sulfur cluster assembly protein
MESTPELLRITAAAAAKIREVIAQQKVPIDAALRVGIKGAGIGCAGVSYLLGFDQSQPNDIHGEVQGIQVLIDPRHSMYVLGMEIDWHEDEYQQGFVFNNPIKRGEDSEAS